MTYSVKELYYTIQGEGANVGRAAVFCRFAGCNLWSGLEEDRGTAVCRFCDTDFVGVDGPGGGRFETAVELSQAAAHKCREGEAAAEPDETRPSKAAVMPPAGAAMPPPNTGTPPMLVVCTGGEPLLQLDEALVDAFHAEDFEVAIETNGTRPVPRGVDWVCVSPKAGAELVVRAGDELKLVYPQAGAEPEHYAELRFRHFFLQPMDGPRRDENTRLAIEYCLRHPQWRLSLQTHKLIGIP